MAQHSPSAPTRSLAREQTEAEGSSSQSHCITDEKLGSSPCESVIRIPDGPTLTIHPEFHTAVPKSNPPALLRL